MVVVPVCNDLNIQFGMNPSVKLVTLFHKSYPGSQFSYYELEQICQYPNEAFYFHRDSNFISIRHTLVNGCESLVITKLSGMTVLTDEQLESLRGKLYRVICYDLSMQALDLNTFDESTFFQEIETLVAQWKGSSGRWKGSLGHWKGSSGRWKESFK